MEKKTIFEIKALYRDDFRVTGFSFGHGKKSACIVGSMRGNENQQIYCCAGLIKELRSLEDMGCIKEGKEILVVPCVNPYSMNIKKRFWSIDNTDINRMFPGYSERGGEQHSGSRADCLRQSRIIPLACSLPLSICRAGLYPISVS